MGKTKTVERKMINRHEKVTKRVDAARTVNCEYELAAGIVWDKLLQ